LPGKEAIGALFTTLFRVFEDLRFDNAFTSTGGCECCTSAGASQTKRPKGST
jgi:hypothetical protein